MRLTVNLFHKIGVMKAMQTFSVTDINDIGARDGLIVSVIPDYLDYGVWIAHHEIPVLHDEYGWAISRINTKTGERCFIVFYKGK